MHRRSSRCESAVVKRKIMMPAAEISSNAANMRGILRRKPDSTMRKASPAALPGGTGRNLRDDRADQREAAGDAQAAQKIGQGGRDAQPAQLLPARGAIKLERSSRL